MAGHFGSKPLNPLRHLAATLIVGVSLASTPVAHSAHITDVVTFKNGDYLTGEVKSLSRGRLSFKNDAVGTINIQWDEIAYTSIDQNIQVETQNGARYFGHIVAGEEAFQVVVNRPGGPQVLEASRVINMNPIDQQGFRDIDLDVSLGYNYSQANDITQFTLGMNSKYRSRERIVSADYSSSISDSTGNESSQRQMLNFNYTRLRTNRWLNDGGISFDQNDELGVDLRTSLSAGGGRILKQSNNSLFVLTGGLKATRENLADATEDVDSLESYGKLNWEWYRYDTPELDWSTNLEIIPSLTESGRIRTEFDATLKWEIFTDLFLQLEYYQSYDSNPQSSTAESSDSGVTTSVSYSF
jgi:hypothetical protein